MEGGGVLSNGGADFTLISQRFRQQTNRCTETVLFDTVAVWL